MPDIEDLSYKLERTERAIARVQDILYELEQAQTKLSAARVEAEEASRARNDLISLALKAGVKQVEVARLTGLSRARIAQLR